MFFIVLLSVRPSVRACVRPSVRACVRPEIFVSAPYLIQYKDYNFETSQVNRSQCGEVQCTRTITTLCFIFLELLPFVCNLEEIFFKWFMYFLLPVYIQLTYFFPENYLEKVLRWSFLRTRCQVVVRYDKHSLTMDTILVKDLFSGILFFQCHQVFKKQQLVLCRWES